MRQGGLQSQHVNFSRPLSKSHCDTAICAVLATQLQVEALWFRCGQLVVHLLTGDFFLYTLCQLVEGAEVIYIRSFWMKTLFGLEPGLL